MQRLVLAILIVAVLAAALAMVAQGLRRALSPPDGLPAKPGAEPVQKLAFTLLIALIAYTAFLGGG